MDSTTYAWKLMSVVMICMLHYSRTVEGKDLRRVSSLNQFYSKPHHSRTSSPRAHIQFQLHNHGEKRIPAKEVTIKTQSDYPAGLSKILRTPYHLVGIPLTSHSSVLPKDDDLASNPARGSFKIDDGAVIGGGTYEIKNDGVDVNINLKIARKQPGQGISPTEETPGGGGGGGGGGGVSVPTKPMGPALCPVPCPPGVAPGQVVTPKPTISGGAATIKPVPTASPASSPGATTSAAGGGATKIPPTTSSGGNSQFDAVQQDALKAHNEYRARHDAPPQTLNKDMSQQAEEWARYLGENDKFEHSPSDKSVNQGENIASWCDSTGETGAAVTKRWYDEVCDPGYGFNNNNMDWGAGHFTQVVWIDSTELGIGYFDKKRDDGYVCRTIVARYRPPGNQGGRFLEMVKKGSFDKAKHCQNSSKRALVQSFGKRRKISKKRGGFSHSHLGIRKRGDGIEK